MPLSALPAPGGVSYQSSVLSLSIHVSIPDCLKYIPLEANICLNAAVLWEVALIVSQREEKVSDEFLGGPDSRILPSSLLICTKMENQPQSWSTSRGRYTEK